MYTRRWCSLAPLALPPPPTSSPPSFRRYDRNHHRLPFSLLLHLVAPFPCQRASSFSDGNPPSLAHKLACLQSMPEQNGTDDAACTEHSPRVRLHRPGSHLLHPLGSTWHSRLNEIIDESRQRHERFPRVFKLPPRSSSNLIADRSKRWPIRVISMVLRLSFPRDRLDPIPTKRL